MKNRPIQCVSFRMRTDHDTVEIDGRTFNTSELRAALAHPDTREADAARYRYLRRPGTTTYVDWVDDDGTPEQLDEAIDAALTQGTRQAEPVALSTLTAGREALLNEAADIAMGGWHSVEKARAFANQVTDYLLAAPALQAGQGEPVAWLIDFPDIPSVKPFAVDHIDNPAPGYRARPLGGITSPTHERAAPAPEPDMRAICEALGFDPTNHHNAAKCPYCRPSQPVAAEGVRLTAWQISERMPNHHRQRTSLENINDVLEVLASGSAESKGDGK